VNGAGELIARLVPRGISTSVFLLVSGRWCLAAAGMQLLGSSKQLRRAESSAVASSRRSSAPAPWVNGQQLAPLVIKHQIDGPSLGASQCIVHRPSALGRRSAVCNRQPAAHSVRRPVCSADWVQCGAQMEVFPFGPLDRAGPVHSWRNLHTSLHASSSPTSERQTPNCEGQSPAMQVSLWRPFRPGAAPSRSVAADAARGCVWPWEVAALGQLENTGRSLSLWWALETNLLGFWRPVCRHADS